MAKMTVRWAIRGRLSVFKFENRETLISDTAQHLYKGRQMSYDTGTLRSRLLGEDRPTKQRMVEALESRLEAGETLEYQLTSDGSLTHEDGDDTYEKGGDGGTLLAVTDRKLVFVVDTRTGLETADVPYTDLKDIKVDSGILSTTLSVTVWGRGTFSVDPDDGETAERVADFATKGSKAWQRVVAALQDARQHISTIPTYVADGDVAAARDARESARENLTTAQQRLDGMPRWFKMPLEERYERVETELAEAWMDARADRGETLLADASDRLTTAGSVDYDGTYRLLARGRDHLEAALTIAVEEGFARASDIQSTLSDLRNSIEELEARPLDLAEWACERAQTADSSEAAISAWEEALDHYRDALAAGWGTDADFDGDDDALRMQIEWVAATVVRERRVVAAGLEADGDEHAMSDNPDQARTHYQAATDQIAMAHRLATQYRAGDAELLGQRLDRLQSKRDDLRR